MSTPASYNLTPFKGRQLVHKSDFRPTDRLMPLWSHYLTLLQQTPQLPIKNALRIASLGRLLPNILLCEGRDDGIFIRLAGSSLEILLGGPVQGKDLLSLIPTDQTQKVRWVHKMIDEGACGFFLEEEMHTHSGQIVYVSSLTLPLMDAHTPLQPDACKDKSDPNCFRPRARYYVAGYDFRYSSFNAEAEPPATVAHMRIIRSSFIDLGFGLPAEITAIEADTSKRSDYSLTAPSLSDSPAPSDKDGELEQSFS